jgi:hypothetical protein
LVSSETVSIDAGGCGVTASSDFVVSSVFVTTTDDDDDVVSEMIGGVDDVVSETIGGDDDVTVGGVISSCVCESVTGAVLEEAGATSTWPVGGTTGCSLFRETLSDSDVETTSLVSSDGGTAVTG